jgi:tetratricopeptide (TPR) repeat protein
MALSSKGYIRQIGLLLDGKEYKRAYEVASEFAEKSPGMQQDYLLGVCSFWTGRYDDALRLGKSALARAGRKPDRFSAILLCASALYRMKRYREGFELLKGCKGMGFNDRIEEMLVYFALALGDAREAVKHAKNLFTLNRELAAGLLE